MTTRKHKHTADLPEGSYTCRICENRDGEMTLGWYVGIKYHQEKFQNFSDALAAAHKSKFTHIFLNFENTATPIGSVKL